MFIISFWSYDLEKNIFLLLDLIKSKQLCKYHTTKLDLQVGRTTKIPPLVFLLVLLIQKSWGEGWFRLLYILEDSPPPSPTCSTESKGQPRTELTPFCYFFTSKSRLNVSTHGKTNNTCLYLNKPTVHMIGITDKHSESLCSTSILEI